MDSIWRTEIIKVNKLGLNLVHGGFSRPLVLKLEKFWSRKIIVLLR